MSAPMLEIIMPVRNAGPILLESIASLTAQTDRRLGVLLSDNHSTSGLENLDEAERQLAKAGIAARRVKPPYELKRVEHWNWAHAQGQAEWLKPLFVGDLLLPQYAARILTVAERKPTANLIRCEFETRSTTGSFSTRAPFSEGTLSPRQFLNFFPHIGNWIGGPINACYRRTAWRAAGGYPVQLPACADYNLYVRLALEAGLENVPECLAAFQLHEQRFSKGIAKRSVNGSIEVWLTLRQARNYCANAKLPWPANGVRRGAWRQLKIDYWGPWKNRMKKKFASK